MNDQFTIIVHDDGCRVVLRTADEGDLDNLRHWKNAHRQHFFHQGLIAEQEQRNWFRAYRQRDDDYMFMVDVDEVAIGCMGVRRKNGEWDVYNVILGLADYGGRGLMGQALQTMLKHIAFREAIPVTLNVLKNNPAVNWYIRNGFVIDSEGDGYYRMVHQPVIDDAKESV